ncbi:Adenylate and Guanylate cyclase catalytic domain protein [Cryptosporidium meleagridis]|uniref:adenylate cyclase n=1 Tax=Cryptosporidium meleagridis TaxID=93969 RepID=A0A2P4YXF6_9CRYT|nr:Adenylate and Guanylate cyclase catalytic domain protein [Cryptosporidium meleagridis]
MTESFGKSIIVATEDENINGINKKPVWISRKIILNLSGEVKGANKYPSNNYSGCKYSIFQFIFISLWTRCRRFPIAISFLSILISFFTNQRNQSYKWINLGFVLIFAILPPFIMDIYIYAKIRFQDYKINSRYCIVFDNDKMEFAVSKWRNLKVGDIVCVLDGEQFPADVVVLHSSGKKAYISSEMVDGSRLVRTCEPVGTQTDLERAIKDFILFPARITCDVPSGDINHFEGSLKWEGKPRAKTLTVENFALMFSRLRFANWVLGVVVYAGTDTKIAIRQHSALENRNRYNPAAKLENIVSQICIAMFLIVSCIGINTFTNKDSNFETYINEFISLLELKDRVQRERWLTIAEFAAFFNFFVPITLTTITDIIKIVGMFRFSRNKVLTTDYTDEIYNQALLTDLRLSPCISKEPNCQQVFNNIQDKNNPDSKTSSYNDLKLKFQQNHIVKSSSKPLEVTFNKFDSLDSFGTVDISLIHQNSIMETQPMRLKIISLNNGQEYMFKQTQKITACPKFSIISGLLWKHNSISWQSNESSRFSNGSIKVIRPRKRISMTNFGLIPPNKLELFHYSSVLLAISKLNVIKNKEKSYKYDKSSPGRRGKTSNFGIQNNKKKIRSYYRKLLFQIKGLKNALIDLPPDPVKIEPRDIWPPLPNIKLNSQQSNRQTSFKSINDLSSIASASEEMNLNLQSSSKFKNNRDCDNHFHPALPIHLFPKRIIQLLNHIILSNQRQRVVIKDSGSFTGQTNYQQEDPLSSGVDHNRSQGSKDYQVFDTRKIQINKEDNEEILYLLFNNIVKLTKNFYGWNTGRKYKIPNEYSMLVKSLLMESIDYSLSTCFKGEKEDKDANSRKICSVNQEPARSPSLASEENEDCSKKSSILIDMLYAMAICNSTVPHLRIVKQNRGPRMKRNATENYCSNSNETLEPHPKAGGMRELRKDRITSGKRINYYHEIPHEIINRSLFSFNGNTSSNLSKSEAKLNQDKDLNNRFKSDLKMPFFTKKKPEDTGKALNTFRSPTINSERRLYIASKSMSMGENMNSDFLKRSSSSRVLSSNESRLFGKFLDGNKGDVKTSKHSNNGRSVRITHRYNTNYEKLHKQRRVGCLNSHAKEILLTKYYLNYYFNASQFGAEPHRSSRDEDKFVENDSENGENMFNNKCWKKLGKRMRNLSFSYRLKSREEKICNYYENFPRSYVQYSGIDEHDLTIVHTAASCGMRLVLVNSQYVVVESLGRTVFSSLIYKSEDKSKQEISMIVKFFQKKDATLYVRGVAEHILPLLNPSLIRSQENNSVTCQCIDQAPKNNNDTISMASQNYEDLILKIRKLQCQGYKVFIFAKKTISENELAKMSLRHKLSEHNNGFRFLLDSSAEDYFQKLKTKLEYLGHVGIEYRIQSKVPNSIRTILDYGIKPWFLFNVSSVNSIRLMHKIFPNYDKIPLIRLDRLPLKNKNKAMSFLSSVYNELKIIMDNNYRVMDKFNLVAEKMIKMEKSFKFSDKSVNEEVFSEFEESENDFFEKKKISNIELLKALITISSPNGEIQLSRLESVMAEHSITDHLENNGGRNSFCNINEDWLGWGGSISGHGILNSLPGIVFSALQLNEIFESRDLLNYFFLVTLISPFVVVSNSTTSDISTISNYLKGNISPRPLILGISGVTGNVPVLSSCDISISVSLTNEINDKDKRMNDERDSRSESAENNDKAKLYRLGKIFKVWRLIKKKNKSINISDTSNIYLLNNFNEEDNSLTISSSRNFDDVTEKDSYLTSEALSEKVESTRLKKKSTIPVQSYTIQDIFKNSGDNFVINPVTDVSVRKFHQIIPLLSRAGRLTSYRVSLAIFNNLFKILLLIIPNLLFQFYCQWSGTLLQLLDVLGLYVIFWTVLIPVFYGIYGIDVPKYLLDLPYLYNSSRSGYYSHWINYFSVFMESFVLGIVSFYLSVVMCSTSPFKNGISADISVLSASMTMYCIMGTLFSFLIKIRSFSTSILITILFNLCSILLIILLLSIRKHDFDFIFRLYGLYVQHSYIFFLSIPLFVSYVILYNLIFKIIMYHILPDPATCVEDWWLIHISQGSKVLKSPIILEMKNSFRMMKPVCFVKSIFSLLRTSFWYEWTMIKAHLKLGNDHQDEYLNPILFESLEIPTLTNLIVSQYQKYFIWKLRNQKNMRQISNKGEDDRSNSINNLTSVEKKEINESNHHMIKFGLQPQIIVSSNSVNIDNNQLPLRDLHSEIMDNGINIQNQMRNISTGSLPYKKLMKFSRPIEMNYFGDNRVSGENWSFEDWKRRVILHANIVWSPKQIYMQSMAPITKKWSAKGMRSLQFAQSLRKFSSRELEEYNGFLLDCALFLSDNKVGLVGTQSNDYNYSRALRKSAFSNNIDIVSNERSIAKNTRSGRNFEGFSNTATSVFPITNNSSYINSRSKEHSTVDLNINLTGSSSNYGRISTFSEDVKALLNPFKLTFKVNQLELEYQIERQIEAYEHRNALRAVLCVISGIFLTLGPFSVNVSNTDYCWVGVLLVVFCLAIFMNFVLSYIYGNNKLSVRFQLPLLVIISVSSILTSNHGFALAVIFPIISFIIFRLGFIPGVYVTIIGFLSVVIGQFIWNMPNSYWIRYLPILLGTNTFCGFLGYRSELLYRAQFLLETHTNDLRQRQRQILDTMLPSFIVERLLIDQKDNPRFSSQNVEDRGTVSILFCDIYDFHSIVALLQPKKLISLLDCFFLTLDCLIDSYNCTKIETVFETYLVASCLDPYDEVSANLENFRPKKNKKSSNRHKPRKVNKSLKDIINLLRFALQIHKIGSSFFYEIPNSKNMDLTQVETDNRMIGVSPFASLPYSSKDRKGNKNDSFIFTGQEMSLKQLKLKIGIHSGRVISGVVGTNKPQYALFGDTVNTASRMKSSCETGKIQVSSMTHDLVKDISILKWKEKRSFVKGKGMMDTFTLESVSGSAYPNYTHIRKQEIRGKWVGAIQIGNYYVKNTSDFDILALDSILLKYLAKSNDAKKDSSSASHSKELTKEQKRTSSLLPSSIQLPEPPLPPPLSTSVQKEDETKKDHFSQELLPGTIKPAQELVKSIDDYREEAEYDKQENTEDTPLQDGLFKEIEPQDSFPLNENVFGGIELYSKSQESSSIRFFKKKEPDSNLASEHETVTKSNRKRMKIKFKKSTQSSSDYRQNIERINSDQSTYSVRKDSNYQKSLIDQRKKEDISDLMSLTLRFKDNEIEQKYLITYYSDLTTLKTIEESLVIVIVTLVLQTLIYTLLPCGQNYENGIQGFRILWTVRIIYISSVFLSWLVLFSTYTNYQTQSSTEILGSVIPGISEPGFTRSGGVGEEARQLSRDKWKGQLSLENTKHIGGPILFLNAVLAGGASMLMLTILWQFTMVDNSISLWCDEEILELLLLATVHHNAGLLFKYIVLFDLLIMFLILTIFSFGINVNLEGIVVYCVALLVNIIAAYSRERTGRAIFYGTLVAGNCEQKAEELLIEMLPRKVLVDFQEDKLKLAYIHKNVTFLFSDICGFTQWAMTVEAESVVYMLSSLYAQFDESLSKFGLFKLFTIGDAYVAMSEPEIDPYEQKSSNASPQKLKKNKDHQAITSFGTTAGGVGSFGANFGLGVNYLNSVNNYFSHNSSQRSSSPGILSNSVSSKHSLSSSSSNNSHNTKSQQIYNLNISQMEGYTPAEGARRSIAMAHDMLEKIAFVREKLSLPELSMRIGLHYGGCIGGIVGSSRLRYEVWGHDVIIGNRMESCGTPGNITISGQLYEVLSKNFNHLFKFSYVGKVSVRKQQIDMYKTRIRKNVKLKFNKVSNSENMSNLIRRNIIYNNERHMEN